MQNSNLELILEKLNKIEKDIENVNTKISQLENDISNMKQSTDKMDSHVDFIDSVYDIIKTPFKDLLTYYYGNGRYIEKIESVKYLQEPITLEELK